MAQPFTIETEIAGRQLTIESGKLAVADGADIIRDNFVHLRRLEALDVIGERIGRVRRESVDNQMAWEKRQFDVVVDNLPEFWGELKRERQSAAQNLKELGF